MTSRSIEDYIKGIYRLQTGKQSVVTSALAKHLKVNDASVTEMVKRLSAKKFIRYEPYQGVTLTEAGRRLALKMVRRHRLWEMFLVQHLGYAWDEIHDEAELLEHVTSDELEQRLDKTLGYPKVDPHGDPIPNVHGELLQNEGDPLSGFDEDDTVRILRVSDENADILQHAAKLGLGLNKKIMVKRRQKFDGTMIIKVGTKDRFISERVAKAIFVELVRP